MALKARDYIFDKLTRDKCPLLERSLMSIPEIEYATVDFATCIATVVYNKKFPEELLRMAAKVTNTAYRCPVGKERKWE